MYAPHTTPLNGTCANLISEEENLFHKGPKAFKVTITVFLGHVKACGEDLHILLTAVKNVVEPCRMRTPVLHYQSQHSSERDLSIHQVCWYPDDIPRRWQIHSSRG